MKAQLAVSDVPEAAGGRGRTLNIASASVQQHAQKVDEADLDLTNLKLQQANGFEFDKEIERFEDFEETMLDGRHKKV